MSAQLDAVITYKKRDSSELVRDVKENEGAAKTISSRQQYTFHGCFLKIHIFFFLMMKSYGKGKKIAGV